MNPCFPDQSRNSYLQTVDVQKQAAHGQSAISGANSAGTVQVNITCQTPGLRPEQAHFHTQQPSRNPLQQCRVRADYTHQSYFNQQTPHQLSDHQDLNVTLIPNNEPNLPAQAHQFDSTPFTHPSSSVCSNPESMHWHEVPVNSEAYIPTHDEVIEFLSEFLDEQPVAPLNQRFTADSALATPGPARIYPGPSYPGAHLSGTTESAFLQFPQGSQACHTSADTCSRFRTDKNAFAMGFGQPTFAPTTVQSQNFIQSPYLSSPRKRPHNLPSNHQADSGEFLAKKPSPGIMTYNSAQAMRASGTSHKHLYEAQQTKQSTHSNQPIPMLTTRIGYSATSSGHIYHEQVAQQAETPISPVVQNLATSKVCPEKTSKETPQQPLTDKASNTSKNTVKFDWQAPVFHRNSKEIKSLIIETQKILGIQNLNEPWISSAHVLVIAADVIDGEISETTLYILQSAHKPDNSLENVSIEIAKVVNDWYQQSDEDKIETEYFELLNSINRFRKAKSIIPIRRGASYKTVLEKAAAIIKHENNIHGSSHLPPKSKRAELTEYIANALEYIHSSKADEPLSNN